MQCIGNMKHNLAIPDSDIVKVMNHTELMRCRACLILSDILSYEISNAQQNISRSFVIEIFLSEG